jgi:hypothetical protein
VSILIKGVSKLSGLEIDIAKDWAANRIRNLGQPIDNADAMRKQDVLELIGPQLDYFTNQFFYCADFEHWLATVTGSGSTGYSSYGSLTLTTGTTAGSTAIRSQSVRTGIIASINWAYPFWVQFLCNFSTQGIAVTKYVYLKLALENSAADLSNKGVAIRFNRNGLALQGQVHNGSARQTVALGSLPFFNGTAGYNCSVFRIVFDPAAGRVDFYAVNNGVWTNLGAITSGLPSGIDLSALTVSISVSNPGTTEFQSAELNSVLFYKPYR